MIFPNNSIVIPTLHRADDQKTLKVYNQDKYPVYLVVEPHDEKNYKQYGYKNIITLPKDGQGLAYCRNFILDNSERNIFMVDDDLKKIMLYRTEKNGFYYYDTDERGKDVFYHGGIKLLDKGFVGVGLPFIGKPQKTRNRRFVMFVGMNTKLIKKYNIRYRLQFFEDFDFQLQIMNTGLQICFLKDVAFDTPIQASNKGGCQDTRNNKTQTEALNEFLKYWNKYARLVMKKNRFIEPVVQWSKCKAQCKEVYLRGRYK